MNDYMLFRSCPRETLKQKTITEKKTYSSRFSSYDCLCSLLSSCTVPSSLLLSYTFPRPMLRGLIFPTEKLHFISFPSYMLHFNRAGRGVHPDRFFLLF